MGLASNDLRSSVLAGYEESARVTENDVATRAGYIEWATPLRHLGDLYVPRGFNRARPGGFEVLRSPDASFDIAVAKGNYATGLNDRMPTTFTKRGPLTGQAVTGNRNQLRLRTNVLAFDRRKTHTATSTGRWTWLLLHHHDERQAEIRVELSAPVEFDGAEEGRDGTVTQFEPRLILPPISLLSANPADEEEDDGDEDIDIPISRR